MADVSETTSEFAVANDENVRREDVSKSLHAISDLVHPELSDSSELENESPRARINLDFQHKSGLKLPDQNPMKRKLDKITKKPMCRRIQERAADQLPEKPSGSFRARFSAQQPSARQDPPQS